MLKELDRNSWENFCQNAYGNIFSEWDFILKIEKSSDTKANFYGFYCGNKLVAATCLPEKNKAIIHPIDFLYTPFAIDTTINPNVINESVQHGLESLKSKYSSIILKLSPEITDIRAFNWAGFDTEVRYTYLQDLTELTYQESVHKKIKKAINNSITFSFGDKKSESIALNLIKLAEFGIAPESIKTTEKFISLLTEKELQNYNAFKEQKLISSNLILRDNKSKMAYTVLLASDKSYQNLGTDVALYDYFFKMLATDGIEKVDLCGANMKSIATFKSSFNPKLSPYFVVRYDKPIRKILKTVKKIIKP